MEVAERIKNLFIPKKQLSGRYWDMWKYNGWGNRISWSDYDERKLNAHTTPQPQLNDEIRDKMASGKIARFVITDIEYVGNVPDMWFATVEDLGYVGEPLLNKRWKEVNQGLIKKAGE